MKRLHLKCLVVSAAVHGLLAVALFTGMGFSAVRQLDPDLALLDVIPAKLIDEALSGGGDPRPPAAAPPAPAPKTLVQPTPAPPPPADPKPHPVSRPAPDMPEPQPKVTPPPKTAEAPQPPPADEPSPQPAPPRKRNIDLTKRTTRTATTPNNTRDPQRAEREAADNARQAAARSWRNQLSGAVDSIRRNLSSGITVEISGGGVGGTGGEAYANYSQAIRSRYNQAWIDPEEVADLSLTVRTRINIARDGRVLSAQIIAASGNSAMDKSVQQALDRVRYVDPFPESSKDLERIFLIKFNLKAKRLLG